jgi:hypothetical protein
VKTKPPSNDFAVQRGACRTLFSTSAAAITYAKAVLGAMVLVKTKTVAGEYVEWKPLLF